MPDLFIFGFQMKYSGPEISRIWTISTAAFGEEIVTLGDCVVKQ